MSARQVVPGGKQASKQARRGALVCCRTIALVRQWAECLAFFIWPSSRGGAGTRNLVGSSKICIVAPLGTWKNFRKNLWNRSTNASRGLRKIRVLGLSRFFDISWNRSTNAPRGLRKIFKKFVDWCFGARSAVRPLSSMVAGNSPKHSSGRRPSGFSRR